MTGRAGVLFDLDGTLVDTNYLHTLAWARALSDAGEWAPMNAIHRLVGMGGDQLVWRLLGHESPRATESRGRRYQELVGDARPFPGATKLLRALHHHDVVVVLATSSPGGEVEAMVQLLGAADAIDARTTADDIERSKPDPGVLQVALRAGSIDPARAMVVGDSVWDIEAARAAGLGCVAVESGGFSQHELAEAGALHVYHDVAEILDQQQTGPLAQLLG